LSQRYYLALHISFFKYGKAIEEVFCDELWPVNSIKKYNLVGDYHT